MMSFVLACLGMLAVTAALLAYPLLKKTGTSNAAVKPWTTFGITVVAIAALTGGLYAVNTKWSWTGNNPVAPTANSVDIDAMVAKLEAQLKANPNNAEGWMMLGRSYVTMQRFQSAVDAYQHAYDLTNGQNIDAITGLAEALVLMDENSLTGRAGQLIDQALKLQPNHPKALWYGGLAALKSENLKVARDRFTALLALNPPEQVRGLLQREVQDLNQQLGNAPVADDKNARKLIVHVSLADSIKKRLQGPISLFVLARDPQQKGGAPLAVERHDSAELPLTVELSKANAMLPTHTIEGVASVEVVARLSRSGAPLEQSGDYVGSAQYVFSKGEQGTINIEINRQVP